MTFALTAFGVFAGALTTLAGQGGGLFLLLVTSFFLGPHAALAVTTPALLLGNLHRALTYRVHVDRGVALRMIAGAVPGSFAGGLLAGAAPPVVLHVLLVVLTVLAIARAAGLVRFHVPRSALGPAGAIVGAMTGTSGGAGILFSPILLAAGLSGRTFVATTSTIAVAAHAGRVVAYAGAGFFTKNLALPTVLVTLAIFLGNVLGERIRRRTTEKTTTRLEYGVLVICVVLSVALST
ncbi:MAG: sulfite exporter TauE/SafE family protein [Deltaproteobacteria bacterium]|nr:sulfite exporter TauE/SafE family protein [Deltaproteobacteria bacterium]